MSKLTTKELEKKIKMWIPYSEAPQAFNMSPYTGKPFDCACGKTHIYNNLTSPPFVDGGMYKMGLMVKECKHLSAVKVRGFFNTDKMELLFGCKFEEKKKRFGFTLEYPKFDEEIKIWIAERWEL